MENETGFEATKAGLFTVAGVLLNIEVYNATITRANSRDGQISFGSSVAGIVEFTCENNTILSKGAEIVFKIYTDYGTLFSKRVYVDQITPDQDNKMKVVAYGCVILLDIVPDWSKPDSFWKTTRLQNVVNMTWYDSMSIWDLLDNMSRLAGVTAIYGDPSIEENAKNNYVPAQTEDILFNNQKKYNVRQIMEFAAGTIGCNIYDADSSDKVVMIGWLGQNVSDSTKVYDVNMAHVYGGGITNELPDGGYLSGCSKVDVTTTARFPVDGTWAGEFYRYKVSYGEAVESHITHSYPFGSFSIEMTNPFFDSYIYYLFFNTYAAWLNDSSVKIRPGSYSYGGNFWTQLGYIARFNTEGQIDYTKPFGVVNKVVTEWDGGLKHTVYVYGSNTVSSGGSSGASSFAIIQQLVADNQTGRSDVASYKELTADKFSTIDETVAGKLSANEAEIQYLKVVDAEANYLKTANLSAAVAIINNLTAQDAIIQNVTAVCLTADNIKAAVATIGYMTVKEADLQYAKIGLANVSIDDVGILFAKVGLLDRATIIEGHVTGYLDAVEVNANKITAGTLCTERLVIRGSNGSIIYSINNITGALQSVNAETINGEVLTDRTINADKIIASSITANELDVNNVFANTSVLNKLVAQDAFIEAVGANEVVVGAKSTADKANTAIQQLQVGARNLYIGTKDFSKDKWINTDLYPGGEFYPSSEWEHEGFDVAISQGGEPGIAQIIAAKNGEVFTLSGYVKSDGGTVVAKAGVSSGATLSDDNQTMTVSNEWTRMSATFHITSDGNIAPRFEQTNTSNNVWVCALKVERGNKATDYTPAPEDVEIVLSEIEGDLLNWCKDNDLTYIDGAKIYTRSIKAEQIDVEDVFAQDVTATGTIRGTNIVGGNIQGTNISGANVQGTNITGGTVSGTNITGVNVTGANIVGGNIKSENYSETSIDGIEFDLINGEVFIKNSVGFDWLPPGNTHILGGGIDLTSQVSPGVFSKFTPSGVTTTYVDCDSLTVSGTKSRVVKTKNYGTRKMYCLETPTPIFSDFGNANLDADGLCYIYLDDVFSETVDMDCNYNVSLTKYGQGELWVEDRQHDCFVVKGTPNMEFGWTINAVQKDYESYRLEEFTDGNQEIEPDYGLIGANYYKNYEKEILNYEESN